MKRALDGDEVRALFRPKEQDKKARAAGAADDGGCPALAGLRVLVGLSVRVCRAALRECRECF